MAALAQAVASGPAHCAPTSSSIKQRVSRPSCAIRSPQRVVASKNLALARVASCGSPRRVVCHSSAAAGAGSPEDKSAGDKAEGDKTNEEEDKPKELTPEEIEAKRREDEENREIAAACFKYLGIVFVVWLYCHKLPGCLHDSTFQHAD